MMHEKLNLSPSSLEEFIIIIFVLFCMDSGGGLAESLGFSVGSNPSNKSVVFSISLNQFAFIPAGKSWT